MLQSNLLVLNCEKPSVARRDSLEFSPSGGEGGKVEKMSSDRGRTRSY